jgi:hypothetical protein
MLSLLSVSLFLLGSSYAATTPANLAPPSTSGALSGLKYTNVGGSGSYQMVTSAPPGVWPSCNVSPSCVKTTKQVSGNLAPFNEDMTVVFRGPMNLKHIAVYQPSDGSASAASWTRKSSWNSGQQSSNIVFMNNKGGSLSGEWSSKPCSWHSLNGS